MRVRRKTIWGHTNSNGELSFQGAELAEFCRLHPNRSIIIRAEVQSKEPSDKLKGYFFGYLIKELQRGLYDNGECLSEQETYNKIRSACPLFVAEERDGEKWKVRRREWEELDQAEAVEVIGWIHRWASENLYLVLDEPK